MKLTLLELTVAVLNATDGDEVNSISDTTESLQIAADIKDIYYDLIGRKDWQFLRKLTTFTSVGDPNTPTHLLIPENTSKMDFLLYNKRTEIGGRNKFKEVRFMFPDEFLTKVNGRDNTQSNYDAISDVNGVVLTIRNDIHPTYYTSFDDKYIVMDAYDSSIESTIQGAQTQASLFKIPTWTVDDTFVPELPAEMFPLFLSECKTYAQARKEDVLIKKTEQTAGRHQRHLSQTHGVVQQGVRYPNYGRHSGKTQNSVSRPAIFGPKV